jgi:hypothetical protein
LFCFVLFCSVCIFSWRSSQSTPTTNVSLLSVLRQAPTAAQTMGSSNQHSFSNQPAKPMKIQQSNHSNNSINITSTYTNNIPQRTMSLADKLLPNHRPINPSLSSTLSRSNSSRPTNIATNTSIIKPEQPNEIKLFISRYKKTQKQKTKTKKATKKNKVFQKHHYNSILILS